MSIYSESGNSARLYAVGLIIAVFLIFASMSPAFGQERSTDRDNPTPLTANVVTDDLDGTDTAYFYKFTAGPGKLTVTIEVKASGTNAGAMLDLFDAKSRPILSDVLAQGVDGGSERIANTGAHRSQCATQSTHHAFTGFYIAGIPGSSGAAVSRNNSIIGQQFV